MICCWSIPRRWSARAPARRSSAAGAPALPTRSPTPPTTAAAPATAATSGDSGCTPCSPPTAPPEHWRSPPQRSTRSSSACRWSPAPSERPGQMLVPIGDKNFRGKDFETELAALDATIMRPRRKDEQVSEAAPRADPPADRIDLPNLQGHPHARTPRRPHPRQPPRPPVCPLRRARCHRVAQPPTRPPQP